MKKDSKKNNLEAKENKIKNNPINKEVRTDKIEQINSVLIQPKPTKVSNYHYNKLKNYNNDKYK